MRKQTLGFEKFENFKILGGSKISTFFRLWKKNSCWKKCPKEVPIRRLVVLMGAIEWNIREFVAPHSFEILDFEIFW